MSDSPDTPGCHPQLLEAAGPGLVGGGGGGVHGEADLQYSTVQCSTVQYSTVVVFMLRQTVVNSENLGRL